MKKIEFGLMSFADMPPETGDAGINTNKRIQNLLEEIKLADDLKMDVFGIGEHHRPDYAVSSPATVLAAAAAITQNIKLTSAVTVLSSDDPVRVYQQFATVDQISNGRAEIMAGRGSFIESFPLFGYNLQDYDNLFEEKLGLLLKINNQTNISWQGRHRAAINQLGVYPRALHGSLPIWLAAGGSPQSAIRAAKLNLPLILAIIGGSPEQFTRFINLYKSSCIQLGKKEEDIQLGINNHVFIGESSGETADLFFPYYAQMMDRVGKDRGWQPITKEQYEYMRSPSGSLMVGSVKEVTEKIIYEYKLFGFTRFLAQASLGVVPHQLTMRSIELFATKVVPDVKKRLGL